MRRLITVIGFELYALLLAGYQMSIGIRTDEAKYLLDIPYPHPPLARFILNLLDGWQYQEFFWRVVLATLMIQAVWLVIDLVKDAKPQVCIAAAACWLLSAAVVLQAGTVMMVVVTALQALMLVWLILRERQTQPYLLALVWLACLFSAYQAVLFLPLVFFLFRKMKMGMGQALMLTGAPIALLALYTLTNPLVLASMVNQAGKDAAETLLQHLLGTVNLWLIGGSIVLSITGTIGLLLRPKAGLLLSLFLVCAYVFVARYDYYAILFTPLLIAGAVLLLRRFPSMAIPIIASMPVGLVVSLIMASYATVSIVPSIYGAIGARSGQGDMLITGSFGHEWQYGTSASVRRYNSLFLEDARAVICLQPCEEMQRLPAGAGGQTQWERLDGAPVEVWIRRL